MPKTKFFCKECGIWTKGQGIHSYKYVNTLKRACIRNYESIPQIPKKIKKYKQRWITVGWYCTRCGRFISDEKCEKWDNSNRIFDDYMEKQKIIPL